VQQARRRAWIESRGATLSFLYTASPARVVFGAGSLARLGEEVERLPAVRALVLCTPGQGELGETVQRRLGGRACGLLAAAQMHVPIANARAAREAARACDADALVAVGGGSTIGLAKAVALTMGLPIVALPTTYSGSEMTPIYGLTDRDGKTTGRDPKVLPRVVIYDPHLTLGLPVPVSMASGFNAIAHAVEGLYARDGNPVTALVAEEGIRALAGALPRLAREPRDEAARSDALYGAWLCGMVLGSVGMALHHKLCHVLGGAWDLPHAKTHAVMLPHVVAFNAAAAPDAVARAGRALGAASTARALFDLRAALDLPVSLAALGMPESGLERAAALATANPYWNPRAVDEAAIRSLLGDAWAGRPPA
jgi:maleylacetate reductase